MITFRKKTFALPTANIELINESLRKSIQRTRYLRTVSPQKQYTFAGEHLSTYSMIIRRFNFSLVDSFFNQFLYLPTMESIWVLENKNSCLQLTIKHQPSIGSLFFLVLNILALLLSTVFQTLITPISLILIGHIFLFIREIWINEKILKKIALEAILKHH